MTDKKLRIGDMLPGGLLTEQEWRVLKHEFDQEKDTKSETFRAMILAQCQQLAQTHCVGENANKCLICGNHTQRKEGLCDTCFNALRVRGVLRQCGHTHRVKNADLVCAYCGASPAVTKGLCRNCYTKMKYRGLNSAEELINYEKANKPKDSFFVGK